MGKGKVYLGGRGVSRSIQLKYVPRNIGFESAFHRRVHCPDVVYTVTYFGGSAFLD
jgi:hypothetical protein